MLSVKNASFIRSNSYPTALPQGSKIKKLSQMLAEPLQNGVFKTKDYYGTGVPLVNVFDLYQGIFVDTDSLDRINITANEQMQFSVEKGDVFFCRSSIKPEGVAWTNCVQDVIEPMTFECHLIRARPNHSIISSLYLSEFCKTSMARQYLLSKASVTTMATIDQASILNLPVIVPPVAEQKRLEKVLINANKNCEQKLRKADELLAGMDAYIREMIGLPDENKARSKIFAIKISTIDKGRIDPEFHNPFYQHRVMRIKKMKHDTLGNIIEFSSETWNQKNDFTGTFPYIEISKVGLKNNEYKITHTPVSEAPSRAKMVVRNGDIVVSTTRPHRGAIATIQCEDGYFIASTGFCVLRKMKRDDISREYLQWILLNDYVLQQFLQRSSGGNYPAIVQDELKKVVIPIPDINIQDEIVKEAVRRKEAARQLKHEAEADWAEAQIRFERKLIRFRH